MNDKKLIQKIKAQLPYYSNVEKRIAQKIVENPKVFITLSMAQLSKEINVSQGSINNFSKKITGGGFSNLKLILAQELPEIEKENHEFSNIEKNFEHTPEKAFEKSNKALKNTVTLNSEETIKNVVKKLLNAKRIELYGIFRSGIIAKDFSYQLLQLGLPATYVDDVLLSPVSSLMLDDKSVVIAISSSGRTKDIIDAVKIAKEKGVYVICLTAHKSSPLSKLANETLISAYSGESMTGESNEARLAQMFLVNCICSQLNYELDKCGTHHYHKVKEILNSHSVDD